MTTPTTTEELQNIIRKWKVKSFPRDAFYAILDLVHQRESLATRAAIERVIAVAEEVIQEERFSGAPHAVNQVIIRLKADLPVTE